MIIQFSIPEWSDPGRTCVYYSLTFPSIPLRKGEVLWITDFNKILSPGYIYSPAPEEEYIPVEDCPERIEILSVDYGFIEKHNSTVIMLECKVV